MDVVDRLNDWLIDLPPDQPTTRPPAPDRETERPTEWIAEALVLSKKRSEILRVSRPFRSFFA